METFKQWAAFIIIIASIGLSIANLVLREYELFAIWALIGYTTVNNEKMRISILQPE
jgi:hypothetical protein